MVESRVTLRVPSLCERCPAEPVLPENNARHADKSPVTSPDVQRLLSRTECIRCATGNRVVANTKLTWEIPYEKKASYSKRLL
jgi:hypothetical protein